MIVIRRLNDYHSHVDNVVLHRSVAASLAQRLRVMPAMVVTGARQTGKTVLTRDLVPGGRRYISLDENSALDTANNDPEALLEEKAPLTIDEVQRAPGLLHALKQAIDRERKPGQFLLTGSANLLLMHKVSESLAGRASYLTLWPMTRREQQGTGSAGIWGDLLGARDDEWLEIVNAQPNEPVDWRELARRGGFPTPALDLNSPEERAIWFDGYVQTYLERDLQDIASIAALPDFRRVMRAASLRIGQVTNQSGIGRDAALTQPTAHRYLNLLETSYLLARVAPYSVNRTKRLIKSPKLYWGDVGVAMHIAQETEPRGEHLENLVLQDLLVWRDSESNHAEVLYWRTTLGEEVDFVIEASDSLLPIEVKSSGRPHFRDTTHLRTFRREYRDKARAGLLLHTGDAVEWVAPDVLAVPWWRIF